MRGKVLVCCMAGLMPLAAQAETPVDPQAYTVPTAEQVLELLQQADQGPNALIAGFEALGFDVQADYDVFEEFRFEPKDFAVNLALTKNDEPIAETFCIGVGSIGLESFGMASSDALSFEIASLKPFTTGIEGRIICTYTFWGPESLLLPFIVDATDWGTSVVGALLAEDTLMAVQNATVVNTDNIGSSAPWAMQVMVQELGDEGHSALKVFVSKPLAVLYLM